MAVVHTEPHPLAGQVVALRQGVRLYDFPRREYFDGADEEFRVQDWADRLLRSSWMGIDLGNPAVRGYAVRVAFNKLPPDDEVVGGQARGLSYLVHVSELAG